MAYKVKIKQGDIAVMEVNGRELELSVMTITPEMAAQIVEDSDKIFTNRTSRKNAVEAYRKDMSEGRWKNNGESIKFSEDGALKDGRHRMLALAKSGQTFDFLVVGNLEKEVEDTIDIGAVRSLDNGIAFTGIHREKNVSGILQLKEKFDKQVYFTDGSAATYGLTRTSLVDKFKANPDMYNNAAIYAKEVSRDSGGILTIKEVGALYLHLTATLGFDRGVVEKFFMKLVTSPRHGRDIYSRAMESLSDRKRFTVGQTERTKLFVKCWNSYVAGRITNNVRFTDGDWFNEPQPNVVIGTVRRESAKYQNSSN